MYHFSKSDGHCVSTYPFSSLFFSMTIGFGNVSMGRRIEPKSHKACSKFLVDP